MSTERFREANAWLWIAVVEPLVDDAIFLSRLKLVVERGDR